MKFRDAVSTTGRLTALSTASRTASLRTRPSYADFDIVSLDPGEDAEAVARTLRARPDVEYAQPAYRMHTQFKPNDPLYAQLQWNLPLIDLESAWDIQTQAGSAVTVAILDTGVAYENATITATIPAFFDEDGRPYPALGRVTIPYAAATQLVSPGRFVAPHDFIWDTTTPLDFDGHGTHISGTVGQLTNDNIGTAGVAFNVKLMPVKVIGGVWDDIFGSPNEGTDDVVARGIRYAADNGAQVINMSIGRTGPANCTTNSNVDGCAPAVEAAIRYAVSKGSFVVIAGGNEFRRRQSDRSRRRNRGASSWRRLRRRRRSPGDGTDRRPPLPGHGGAAGLPRLLLQHGKLDRAVGPWWIGARLRPRWLRLAADLRFQLHRHVPAAAVPVPRAAVRRLRVHR